MRTFTFSVRWAKITLHGEAWEAWVTLNYQLGKDPSVHGGAEHLLYVGRKRCEA